MIQPRRFPPMAPRTKTATGIATEAETANVIANVAADKIAVVAVTAVLVANAATTNLEKRDRQIRRAKNPAAKGPPASDRVKNDPAAKDTPVTDLVKRARAAKDPLASDQVMSDLVVIATRASVPATTGPETSNPANQNPAARSPAAGKFPPTDAVRTIATVAAVGARIVDAVTVNAVPPATRNSMTRPSIKQLWRRPGVPDSNQ